MVWVARAEEIPPGERKFVDIDGIEIAVLNLDGAFYSVRNFCPHMEGPLARGTIYRDENDNPRVECPFHGWTFDLETGEATFNSRQTVRTFEVTVVDGDIYVDL